MCFCVFQGLSGAPALVLRKESLRLRGFSVSVVSTTRIISPQMDVIHFLFAFDIMFFIGSVDSKPVVSFSVGFRSILIFSSIVVLHFSIEYGTFILF